MRRKRFDGVGDDIGANDIIHAGGFVGQIANQHFQLVADAVACGVFARGAYTHGVNVYALGAFCAQFQRGDGQNAGTRADIQHALTTLDEGVQRFQTKCRGFMGAGAEGHAGVKRNHCTVGGVLLPAGHDGQAAANVHGVIILLPAVLPILLLHAGKLHAVGDFGACQTVLHQLGHFGGVFVGRKIQVHNHFVAVFVQKLLLD